MDNLDRIKILNKIINESYSFYTEDEDKDANSQEPKDFSLDNNDAVDNPSDAGEQNLDAPESDVSDGEDNQNDDMVDGDDFMDDDTQNQDIPQDDVEEIDITDLVNKLETINNSIDINNKTTIALKSAIEKLSNMENIVNSINILAKQVELMRPETESERRNKMLTNSYPFVIKPEDYGNNNLPKRVDDLSKMSKEELYDKLTSFSNIDIKKSFNIPR